MNTGNVAARRASLAASVITTVSTPDKAELSRRAGAVEVLDYPDDPQAFGARIRELTERLKLDRDAAIDTAAIESDFAAFIDSLHVQLHDIALEQQPLGLARFGMPGSTSVC